MMVAVMHVVPGPVVQVVRMMERMSRVKCTATIACARILIAAYSTYVRSTTAETAETAAMACMTATMTSGVSAAVPCTMPPAMTRALISKDVGSDYKK